MFREGENITVSFGVNCVVCSIYFVKTLEAGQVVDDGERQWRQVAAASGGHSAPPARLPVRRAPATIQLATVSAACALLPQHCAALVSAGVGGRRRRKGRVLLVIRCPATHSVSLSCVRLFVYYIVYI